MNLQKNENEENAKGIVENILNAEKNDENTGIIERLRRKRQIL